MSILEVMFGKVVMIGEVMTADDLFW